MAFYPLVILQLLLSAFADKIAGYRGVDAQKLSPEDLSSTLNRITFWWFTPMAWKGWRKTLESIDLWPLSLKDSSSGLVPKWEELWNNAMIKYWERKKDYKPKPAKSSKVLKVNENGTEMLPLNEESPGKKKNSKQKKPALQLSEREKAILACSPSISITLMKLFIYQLLISGFLQLLCDLLKFSNPLLLKYEFTESNSLST